MHPVRLAEKYTELAKSCTFATLTWKRLLTACGRGRVSIDVPHKIDLPGEDCAFISKTPA